jgi:hypothetical protein
MRTINIKKIKESEVCSKLSSGFYIVDLSEQEEGLPFDFIYISDNKISYLGNVNLLNEKLLNEILEENTNDISRA